VSSGVELTLSDVMVNVPGMGYGPVTMVTDAPGGQLLMFNDDINCVGVGGTLAIGTTTLRGQQLWLTISRL
jgi:hypothetical protein